MGGHRHVLWGEFFGGRWSGLDSGGHGVGHARDWATLVFEGIDGGVGKLSEGCLLYTSRCV